MSQINETPKTDAYYYAIQKQLKNFDVNYDAYEAAHKHIMSNDKILEFKTVRGHDVEGRDEFYLSTLIDGKEYRLISSDDFNKK